MIIDLGFDSAVAVVKKGVSLLECELGIRALIYLGNAVIVEI